MASATPSTFPGARVRGRHVGGVDEMGHFGIEDRTAENRTEVECEDGLADSRTRAWLGEAKCGKHGTVTELRIARRNVDDGIGDGIGQRNPASEFGGSRDAIEVCGEIGR